MVDINERFDEASKRFLRAFKDNPHPREITNQEIALQLAASRAPTVDPRLKDAVAKCLMECTPKQVEVINVKFFQETTVLSNKTVASMLHFKSVRSVRKCLQSAYARMKRVAEPLVKSSEGREDGTDAV